MGQGGRPRRRCALLQAGGPFHARAYLGQASATRDVDAPSYAAYGRARRRPTFLRVCEGLDSTLAARLWRLARLRSTSLARTHRPVAPVACVAFGERIFGGRGAQP